ncbi:MAG: hypothetical protein ABSA62_14800, partial [Methyloceanibacter sp.]
MKHAVELDTLDIVDRLNNLTRKAAALAAGILGFEGQEDAPGGLQDIALEIHDELERLSDEIHPTVRAFPTRRTSR